MRRSTGQRTPQNREGKKEAAIGTIAELKKRYPQSRWKKGWRGAGDRNALEDGIQSKIPRAQNDEDLKTALRCRD